MGALPKRKPSTHRQGRRRARQIHHAPPLTICSQCGGEKLPHFVCPHCGSWGKQNKNETVKDRSKTPKKTKDR